ncbi:unnamed protein product [Ixodes persulcatus]
MKVFNVSGTQMSLPRSGRNCIIWPKMTPSTRTSIFILTSLLLLLWLFSFSAFRPTFRQIVGVWSPVKWSYYPWYNRDSANVTKEVPRILLWTSFYGTWIGSLNNSRTGEMLTTKCSRSCILTNDRSRLESSDAVVFHIRDIDMANLPQRRSPFQKWVFWSMEPPPYSVFAGFKYMMNMFNWTMTYRFDSDIPVQYGQLERKEDVAPRKNHSALWKSKSVMAVWMVSHCGTDGRREAYVKELKKYLKVDVYGLCGDHKCSRSRGTSCYSDFERKYFFMLAFENSICRDYITEKFFTALRYDMVPVVFGGANYTRVAPPRSFIDALSFKSPKHLAEHLTRVAKNVSAYKSYFDWKSHYKILSWSEEFCTLCSKLHGKDFREQTTYSDMRVWWEQEGRCRSWNL